MPTEIQPIAAESPPPRAKATPEERFKRIAKAAYFKAEKRGFAPGHEQEDWLEAVREVESLGDYWMP